MKVIIFGATGNVGRKLVVQALAQGHAVSAFTRNSQDSGLAHDNNLKTIEGDVLDQASVAAAINGHEAVICALGMPLNNKDGLRAKGTANIIRGMEKNGVKRLVCLSGLGIGNSRVLMPFFYKYFILPVILRHVYADHAVQEEHIKASALDWVIVRASNFSKSKAKGTYWRGFAPVDRALKLKISHADVADFMLRQLADDAYLHSAPGVSY